MIFQRASNAAYRDDDCALVMALRYATEPPRKPWGAFLAGCCTDAAVLSVLLFGTFAVSVEAIKTNTPHVTRLYVPPPAELRKPKQPPPPPSKALISRMPPPHLEDPVDAPRSKDRVNMNSITISVVDDDTNQLPEVVQQQQGIIAMVDPEDQAIARYVFQPPAWQMSDRMVDVSGRIRFSMSPPARWPLLRTLADRNSVAMERYRVDALFDSSYTHCLEQEIRNYANASGHTGHVRTALIVFKSSRSCGIDVVDLTYTDR